MTHREIILNSLTLGFEILLCVLVYIRCLQRRLPFFAAQTIILLAGTISLQFIYHLFGFRSTESFNAYWLMAGLIMIARGFAVAELCRFELRAYRGIWAMAWRALTLLALLLLIHAGIEAWGQFDVMAICGLTIERDFAISSLALLLVTLLIRNYYGLTLEPLQKWIAVGMSVVCVVDVVNDTILHGAFTGYLFYWFFDRYLSFSSELRPAIEHANLWWGTVRTSAFIISIGIWCFALRKPLPAPVPEPDLLPAEVYGTLSPAVNLRLRAFNDRLQEMLKP